MKQIFTILFATFIALIMFSCRNSKQLTKQEYTNTKISYVQGVVIDSLHKDENVEMSTLTYILEPTDDIGEFDDIKQVAINSKNFKIIGAQFKQQNKATTSNDKAIKIASASDSTSTLITSSQESTKTTKAKQTHELISTRILTICFIIFLIIFTIYKIKRITRDNS